MDRGWIQPNLVVHCLRSDRASNAFGRSSAVVPSIRITVTLTIAGSSFTTFATTEIANFARRVILSSNPSVPNHTNQSCGPPPSSLNHGFGAWRNLNANFRTILIYCVGPSDRDSRIRCWHHSVVPLDRRSDWDWYDSHRLNKRALFKKLASRGIAERPSNLRTWTG